MLVTTDVKISQPRKYFYKSATAFSNTAALLIHSFLAFPVYVFYNGNHKKTVYGVERPP